MIVRAFAWPVSFIVSIGVHSAVLVAVSGLSFQASPPVLAEFTISDEDVLPDAVPAHPATDSFVAAIPAETITDTSSVSSEITEAIEPAEQAPVPAPQALSSKEILSPTPDDALESTQTSSATANQVSESKELPSFASLQIIDSANIKALDAGKTLPETQLPSTATSESVRPTEENMIASSPVEAKSTLDESAARQQIDAVASGEPLATTDATQATVAEDPPRPASGVSERSESVLANEAENVPAAENKDTKIGSPSEATTVVEVDASVDLSRPVINRPVTAASSDGSASLGQVARLSDELQPSTEPEFIAPATNSLEAAPSASAQSFDTPLVASSKTFAPSDVGRNQSLTATGARVSVPVSNKSSIAIPSTNSRIEGLQAGGPDNAAMPHNSQSSTLSARPAASPTLNAVPAAGNRITKQVNVSQDATSSQISQQGTLPESATLPVESLASNVAQPVAEQQVALGPIAQQPDVTPREIRKFIQTYNSDGCFFAVPTALGGSRPRIEGFGLRTNSIHDFGENFRRALGVEPEIQSREVTEAQCPAISFIGSLLKSGLPDLGVNLQREEISSGTVLQGHLERVRYPWIYLILIDDDGTIHDLSEWIKQVEGRLTFAAPMVVQGQGHLRNQLLVSISSTKELQLPKTDDQNDPVTGDQFFPLMQKQVNQTNAQVDFGIKAFQVK